MRACSRTIGVYAARAAKSTPLRMILFGKRGLLISLKSPKLKCHQLEISGFPRASFLEADTAGFVYLKVSVRFQEASAHPFSN